MYLLDKNRCLAWFYKRVNFCGFFKERALPDMHILVFPIDMDKVTDFISTVKSLGIKLTGASSVMSKAEGYNIDYYHKLPFVTEDTFEEQFDELISNRSITHVYTPHGGVWMYLFKLKKLKPTKFSFILCEPSPYVEDWIKFKPSYDWAEMILKERFVEFFIGCKDDARKKLLLGQYASLHKQFTNITGQCDVLKLLALVHISRLIPEGDLVEIGSFSGRSAFGIAWLAQKYRIGSLVCIDPWSHEKIEDQGEQSKILNSKLVEGGDLIDFDKIFSSYIGAVSLLDNVGFIRDISENAVTSYIEASQKGVLINTELGEVDISGEIAMLHIDGNHRYDYVCKDIEAWEPLVKPGGWVLLDDYVWAFGDGPKKAGDELLHSGKFDFGFTMSDTLFLRKKMQDV
tara:strand:- start:14829 stop:16031 length:1203 start_codon:yes stop_codon:yes gene_type:complete